MIKNYRISFRDDYSCVVTISETIEIIFTRSSDGLWVNSKLHISGKSPEEVAKILLEDIAESSKDY